MSAKKPPRTKTKPSPGNTPTLFSFFSPSGRGTKYERPSSARSVIDVDAEMQDAVPVASVPSAIDFDVNEDDVPIIQRLSGRNPDLSPSSIPRQKRLESYAGAVAEETPTKKRSRSVLPTQLPKYDAAAASDSVMALDSMAFVANGPKNLEPIQKVTIKSDKIAVKEAISAPSWQTNPQDSKGNHRGDPDYDPSTIMVPKSALQKMTPGQKQYWEIKMNHYDMILFFKMGKFYELYDDDAVIGNKHLNLLFMRGDRPHTGFPEKAFQKYAQRLVRLGYKIARVEQVETPLEMKERNSSTGSKSKVVNRELCSVLTKGTLTDNELIGHASAVFLLALTESPSGGEYGVCFCDTSTSRFHVGEFVDDPQRTRLRTLLACVSPAEIVLPASGLHSLSVSILRKDLPANVIRNSVPGSNHRQAVMDMLAAYFPDTLPPTLLEATELAMAAVGNISSYLQRCLLDDELLKIGSFLPYDCNDADTNIFMALDGQTIANLEIVQNSEGGLRGSLLEYIDHCVTPFGHRRLREWIIRPLSRSKDINDRLDAVHDLIENSEQRETLRSALKKLPDLGRLLSRIHAYACGRDNKAVMYENVGAARLNMFLDVLEGFRLATSWFSETSSFASPLLQGLTTLGQHYPDLSPILDTFEKAFDIHAARRDGFVIPSPGVVPEYDDAEKDVKGAEYELEQLLKQERKNFKDSTLSYVHKNNERYQLEISENCIARRGRLPVDYEKVSQKKGFVRYYTKDIRSWVEELEKANEKKTAALSVVSRQLFAKFCEHYSSWSAAVSALADLDCLCAMAITSEGCDGEAMCRPEFVDRDYDVPATLELRAARHPSLTVLSRDHAGSFIPNDTVIAGPSNPASFILVTGPNMGGKSTLLRQTCICVILSQLGCYVPAELCRLTPVDRIFTRVGACDRILTGQSTFFVELEETSTILRQATRNSLVILDELGRGTSTFDGTAIAYAVAHHLSHKTRCRALFATHYHLLLDEFRNDTDVATYHMSSRLDPQTQSLTFLYKFIPGICPASFGVNVAKMAGLPEEVIIQAASVTSQFEMSTAKSRRALLRQMVQRKNVSEIRRLCSDMEIASICG